MHHRPTERSDSPSKQPADGSMGSSLWRRYEAHNVTPAYPFGHGLSYTTFAYSALTVSNRTVSFTLHNTGNVSAVEVPQLYVPLPRHASQRGIACALIAWSTVVETPLWTVTIKTLLWIRSVVNGTPLQTVLSPYGGCCVVWCPAVVDWL